jgi:arsenical-resistance protein 2
VVSYCFLISWYVAVFVRRAAWREYERVFRYSSENGARSAEPFVGSSRGRGTRCSGWFADYIAENGETADYIDDTEETGVEATDIQSLTLEGGIKGWVKAGDEYTQELDGYKPAYWKQFDEPANK